MTHKRLRRSIFSKCSAAGVSPAVGQTTTTIEAIGCAPASGFYPVIQLLREGSEETGEVMQLEWRKDFLTTQD